MPVYMIQTGDGSAVKIGFAENVASRFYDMQSCSPDEMQLIAIIDGGRKEEREIQQEFARFHLRGEWFRVDDSILERAQEHGVPEDFFGKRKPRRRPGFAIASGASGQYQAGSIEPPTKAAEMIQSFLDSQDWSQAKLAKTAGIPATTVRNILLGKGVTATTLSRLQAVRGLAVLQAKHFENGGAS